MYNDCLQTCLCFTFEQRIVMRMCMHARGHQMMVEEQARQQTFRAVSFITHFHIAYSSV